MFPSFLEGNKMAGWYVVDFQPELAAFWAFVLAPDPGWSRNGFHVSPFSSLSCTLRLRCLTGFVKLAPP